MPTRPYSARGAFCIVMLAAVALPASARESAAGYGDDFGADGIRMPSSAETMRDALARRHVTSSRSRSGTVEWDDGGIRLQAVSSRSGEKTLRDTAASEQWHRRYSAAAEGWRDLCGGFRAIAAVRIDRSTQGLAGGPLLTARSRTLSQRADIGIEAAGRGRISMSVFDRGGWTRGTLAEVAGRIAAGEDPARKGMAFEVSDSPFGGSPQTGLSSLTFRLERSNTSLSPETSIAASLSMRLHF